jgi:hypothetical protein
MSGNGYKLLGYVVWRGAKWYLRRRLPSARKVALAVGAGVTGAVAAAAIAKRISG